MHPPSQFLFDFQELCLHAVLPGFPTEQEFPLAGFAADEGEAEKCEGIRFTKATPGAVGDRGENLERAIACWQSAVPLLRLDKPPRALAALTSIGAALRELGRLQEARTTWQEALTLREILLSAGTSAETRGEAARLSRDLVGQLMRLETELGDPRAAVATLERGRAIALRAGLSLAWLEGLSHNLRAPIERARSELERLRQTLPAISGKVQPGAVRAWEQDIAAAQAALAAELAVAQAATGFSPPPPLDAAALATLAPPGGAVVLLASAPEGGMAFLLPHAEPSRPPTIQTVKLPGATSAVLRAMLIAWNDAYRSFLATMRQTRSVERAALLTAKTRRWRRCWTGCGGTSWARCSPPCPPSALAPARRWCCCRKATWR